jgi:hypothetical protein
VGGDDGAAASFVTGNASTSAGGLDAYIEDDQIAVKFITVACSGACATVEAVGTGGSAPYTFAWDDGSTSATRRVCPTADASYWVKVTDTATTGEISIPAQTVKASLTADVLACSDAAASSCDGGAGPATPAPGLYAGTFLCAPGPDGGIVALPEGPDGSLVTGDFWVDLAFDPVTGQPTGTLYGKWIVLGVIQFQASLQGSVDCATGEVQSPWVNGVWGLPGPVPEDGGAPLSVLAAGTAPGDLTASVVPGSPGMIMGAVDWAQSSTDNGSTCHGTYSATLQP